MLTEKELETLQMLRNIAMPNQPIDFAKHGVDRECVRALYKEGYLAVDDQGRFSLSQKTHGSEFLANRLNREVEDAYKKGRADGARDCLRHTNTGRLVVGIIVLIGCLIYHLITGET